jgi:hypothetical protein
MAVDHGFHSVVQPEALRAPEVTLGLTWRTPIDIWSFAGVAETSLNAC